MGRKSGPGAVILGSSKEDKNYIVQASKVIGKEVRHRKSENILVG